MARRSGQQGVPVIDIGGRIVVEFDRVKIDKYRSPSFMEVEMAKIDIQPMGTRILIKQLE